MTPILSGTESPGHHSLSFLYLPRRCRDGRATLRPYDGRAMGSEQLQVAGDGGARRLDMHDPVDEVDHECNRSSSRLEPTVEAPRRTVRYRSDVP